jgi:protein-S-isoprenylcysteine O-methyltransferase Ste14
MLAISRPWAAPTPAAKSPCLHAVSGLELKVPPVLVTVIFAALMWLISRLAPGITLSATLRVACLLLFAAAGAFIGMSAVTSFRKAQTTVNPLTPEACSSLVDSGVFRFSRNPMYLALLLSLAGWAWFLGNLYSLALTALFVAYMNRFQIQPEERALEAVFGETFIEYRRRVRRWL